MGFCKQFSPLRYRTFVTSRKADLSFKSPSPKPHLNRTGSAFALPILEIQENLETLENQIPPAERPLFVITPFSSPDSAIKTHALRVWAPSCGFPPIPEVAPRVALRIGLSHPLTSYSSLTRIGFTRIGLTKTLALKHALPFHGERATVID